MISNDPNLLVLQLVARELESLLDELTLVGGCAVGLLITDQGRPPIRETVDVDLITEVTTKISYYKLSKRLNELGFVQNGDVFCRFTKGPLIIDVMPTDDSLLGFGSHWYSAAAKKAVTFELPSGQVIKHVSAPFLLATKLEAFDGRGKNDFMHHDIEDIVNLVDGRPALPDEVSAEDDDLKDYIRDRFDDLLGSGNFTESIPRHFHPSEDHATRLPIILKRMRRLAGL